MSNSNLVEQLKQVLELPPDPSEKEQRLQDIIVDSQTLSARADGYSWGQRDEHERTRAVVQAMLEILRFMPEVEASLNDGYHVSLHADVAKALAQLEQATEQAGK